MEILTGVERRRRWSVEAKLRILHEAGLPGASVAAVADRYEICRTQIYQWRRELGPGQVCPEDRTGINFLPVEVCAAPDGMMDAAASSEASDVQVKITLRCGRRLHLPSRLSSAEIRRLVVAVEQA